MARQAEEDLARQRAFDNGTDFGTELRAGRSGQAPEQGQQGHEQSTQSVQVRFARLSPFAASLFRSFTQVRVHALLVLTGCAWEQGGVASVSRRNSGHDVAAERRGDSTE